MIALSNSFGFGGNNASGLHRRVRGRLMRFLFIDRVTGLERGRRIHGHQVVRRHRAVSGVAQLSPRGPGPGAPSHRSDGAAAGLAGELQPYDFRCVSVLALISDVTVPAAALKPGAQRRDRRQLLTTRAGLARPATATVDGRIVAPGEPADPPPRSAPGGRDGAGLLPLLRRRRRSGFARAARMTIRPGRQGCAGHRRRSRIVGPAARALRALGRDGDHQLPRSPRGAEDSRRRSSARAGARAYQADVSEPAAATRCSASSPQEYRRPRHPGEQRRDRQDTLLLSMTIQDWPPSRPRTWNRRVSVHTTRRRVMAAAGRAQDCQHRLGERRRRRARPTTTPPPRAGLVAFSRAGAVELARKGIRINAVLPGIIGRPT